MHYSLYRNMICSQIYSKMGSTRRRSIPLLRALAFNLQKKRSDESDPQSSLNMRHISNCLFAMSQLSYVDKVLSIKNGIWINMRNSV